MQIVNIQGFFSNKKCQLANDHKNTRILANNREQNCILVNNTQDFFDFIHINQDL